MVQDIQISDKTLWRNYIQEFIAGNYQNAFNIINNNSQLQNKAFVADVINNLIAEKLTYLVQENADMLNALANGKDTFNSNINQFSLKGEYRDTVKYYPNNSVIYNKEIYICILESLGNAPTDETYWTKLGLKGEHGAYGIDLVVKHYWLATENYNAMDLVSYDNKLWVAKRTNINKTPQEGADWFLFLSPADTSILLLETGDATYTGQVWFMPVVEKGVRLRNGD